MKQLLQNLRTGETALMDVPVPEVKPGTALVRTACSLVSTGTERKLVAFAEKTLLGKARSRPDLLRQVLDKARREGLLTTIEAAFNRLDQRMPLGYSSAGTIVAMGEGLSGFRVGDRVACAGGGHAVHAEYAVIPQNLLAPLPESVDFESAAFTTLGAIAMHGFRLGGSQIGERVGIIGLGVLGLLTAGIASAAGCQVFGVDIDPDRVSLATQLGFEAVTRNQAQDAARAFSRGRGVDSVLICADTPSNDPVTLAGHIARDRARIIAIGNVGLQVPRKLYYEKELSLFVSRSYGPGRYDPQYEEQGLDYPIGYIRWTEGRNLEAFVGLLASGKLDVKPLITHRFPIEQAPEAYDLITGKRQEDFLAVLITYPEAPTTMERRITYPVFKAEQRRKPAAVKLGVLGAGNFANAVLLPILKKNPHIELIGVASASGTSAAQAARKFGFQFGSSSPAEVLQDEEINTVAILTRHHLHADQVTAALQSGKHVFCEKPLALSEDELATVEQALATHCDCLLMVGFNRRFAPLTQRLHAFLQDRQEPLVAHYRVNAGYLPLEHWLHDPAQGGGRILGEACHFVDFLTFLVGQPPSEVTIQALPDAGHYYQDNVVMTFSFPDGSLGTVSYLANGDRAFPKERMEVFGGGKVAVLDDFRTLELVNNGQRRYIRSPLRQDKGHRAEWDAFVQAIIQGSQPPIPYDQIFGVHQAIFQAIRQLSWRN